MHLAAHHRVLRAQQFEPGSAAHFSLFALVSSGRGQAGRAKELSLLRAHGRAWAEMMTPILGPDRLRIAYSTYGDAELARQISDEVGPGVASAGRGPRPRARARLLCARLDQDHAPHAGTASIEIGDGGFTGWTARLTADAKERCLVSCISTERLAAAAAE